MSDHNETACAYAVRMLFNEDEFKQFEARLAARGTTPARFFRGVMRDYMTHDRAGDFGADDAMQAYLRWRRR
ncbi:MAG: hypothetical protein IT381_10260 [Deltaproteobacteria bacterium]|nr:hypothetical protein [Deltaproteobacteria bacterium]